MPAQSLLWNSPVQVSAGGHPGGLVHYFSQVAQVLYAQADDGMNTKLMSTPEGQYDGPFSEDYTLLDADIAALRLDHPAFGILFASWVIDGELVMAIYVYAADLSGLVEKLDITEQSDNAIKRLALTLRSARADLSEHDMSLLAPGAAITPYLAMGNSERLPMGRYYLDTGPHDPLATTLSYAGRSRIGRLLRDTKFDLHNSTNQAVFTGTPAQIVRAVIERASDGELAGDDIVIQAHAATYTAEFHPDGNVLDGLLEWLETFQTPETDDYPDLEYGATGEDVRAAQKLLNSNLPPGQTPLVVDGIFGPKTRAAVRNFQRAKGLPDTGIINQATWAALLGATTAAESWGLAELFDGRIIVGNAEFISQYRPTDRYTFTRGQDVITRRISRSLDAAYARVGVHYTVTVGDEKQDAYAYATAGTWPTWAVPTHRTYYLSAPEGATADQAQALADKTALSLQYAGVVEAVYGPIRPELLVGDIAQISDGEDAATVTGLITEVRHTLGAGGAFTSFSSDSGGAIMEVPSGEDVAIITTALKHPTGANRNRRMADVVRGVVR